MPPTLRPLASRVARDLGLSSEGTAAALALFDEGNTLPFVARYRKERTGGLDEVQLRDVLERARYLADLEERRETILASIEDQGALTPELRQRVGRASTKQELEDLYLPYRPKRRTRATLARERGLEPLADLLWEGKVDDAGARREARRFVDASADVADEEAALAGARDILAERVAEDAALRGWLRGLLRAQGTLTSRAVRGKKDLPAAQRFRDYFEHADPMKRAASHRVLALRRGEAEGVLAWGVEAPAEAEARVTSHVLGRGPARAQLQEVAEDAWKRLLHPSVESQIKGELVEEADEEAIGVFGTNLENLLLQPPAGERVVLGLDPGFRSGVKAAVVSRTGAVLDTAVLPLHEERRFREGLIALARRHRPELVAVGNGTAARETEKAAAEALAGMEAEAPAVVVVNEAGASVYSASELARDELPDLDVTLRGAVSIARRLQDPLAELVKIDPRSIGVGQYQHDVDQGRMRGRLDDVVELCVNRVGVEVNTASAPLLSYVAGIGPTLAAAVVELRDARGGIGSRKDLLDVPRLGPKTFEQAAGFLRVRGGAHPLDATAVHPERYRLVERMARDLGTDPEGLLGDGGKVAELERVLDRYVSEDVGLPTLRDIVAELRQPGRDPRERFEPLRFRDDVREPADLEEGMVLPGEVTNVVAFGAFVDVGVHQDGLVHVSQLADRFVKDPHEVVRVGQRVKVRVLSVDLERGRIGLSMKGLA
ncbi:MAG: RNA-binding transcriptional accessory protein [Gemmatimonadetes bacterium]|nr:RNA-binding transcriptional accessory protein [Gemmatimonadota bacterium]